LSKRIIDFVMAVMLSLIFFPIIVLTALLVRLSFGSPLLFRQTRPGYQGRPFVMYKFRTMTDARNEDGGLYPDAQRLTPVGRQIRRLSLDELPELWNVIRGDMSLVGPRPLLMEYLPLYSEEQARRHEVRPGLTGLAQVSGRNELSWGRKFELDVWYVDHRSNWLDLKILLKTVGKVLAMSGISQANSATAEKFKG
jgi:sugar transferase EpsL